MLRHREARYVIRHADENQKITIDEHSTTTYNKKSAYDMKRK